MGQHHNFWPLFQLAGIFAFMVAWVQAGRVKLRQNIAIQENSFLALYCCHYCFHFSVADREYLNWVLLHDNFLFHLDFFLGSRRNFQQAIKIDFRLGRLMELFDLSDAHDCTCLPGKIPFAISSKNSSLFSSVLPLFFIVEYPSHMLSRRVFTKLKQG